MSNVKVKLYERSLKWKVEETNEKVSVCRCHGDDRQGDYISMVCTEEDVAKTKEYILDEEINFINEQIEIKQRRLKKFNDLKEKLI